MKKLAQPFLSEDTKEKITSIALVALFLMFLGICALVLFGAVFSNRSSKAKIVVSHDIKCTISPVNGQPNSWTITFNFREIQGQVGGTITERELVVTDSEGKKWYESGTRSKVNIYVPPHKMINEENSFTLVSSTNNQGVFINGHFTVTFQGRGDDNLPIKIQDTGKLAECGY